MEPIKRIALALVLTAAPAAFAQLSLVPAGDCGTVTLNVSGGTGLSADDVKDAYVFLPRQRVAAKVTGDLTFNATVPETGVVMAAVELKPEVSGNETRTEHAKTLLFCGATPVADWQRSTGLGLEVYPQGWNGPRPKLKAGDPMRFIAVDAQSKKLLGDLPMELYRVGGDRIATGVAVPEGGMTFPYQKPGRYMVVTTYRRPDPAQQGHWLVDTSTLTFEIK